MSFVLSSVKTGSKGHSCASLTRIEKSRAVGDELNWNFSGYCRNAGVLQLRTWSGSKEIRLLQTLQPETYHSVRQRLSMVITPKRRDRIEGCNWEGWRPCVFHARARFILFKQCRCLPFGIGVRRRGGGIHDNSSSLLRVTSKTPSFLNGSKAGSRR